MIKKLGSMLLIFEIALWVGMLFCGIAIYPIEIIARENDSMLSAMTENLLRALLGAIGTAVTLFLLALRDGYRNKEHTFSTIAKTILLVFAVQQILAIILQYRFFIAGTSEYLATAIYWKNAMNPNENPLWINHICMLAFDIVLFIPVFISGEYLGGKKRQKERNELLNSNQGGE